MQLKYILYILKIVYKKKEFIMPKIFGWQHLTYLAVFIVVSALTIFLSKKYLKDSKSQNIYLKVVAGLILISEILNRIFVAKDSGWNVFIPNTFCGFSSLAISLLVLFGKPKMKVFQCFWYMAFFGGIITLVYPDFIGQAQSLFYSKTITGLLHHSFDIILCINLFMFGWFEPDLKNWYYFPMVFTSYIVLGAFEMSVLGVGSAMSINKAIIGNGVLTCWFIWSVGSVLVFLASYLYNLMKRKKEPSLILDKNDEKLNSK